MSGLGFSSELDPLVRFPVESILAMYYAYILHAERVIYIDFTIYYSIATCTINMHPADVSDHALIHELRALSNIYNYAVLVYVKNPRSCINELLPKYLVMVIKVK